MDELKPITMQDRIQQVGYLIGLHTTVVATADRINQEIKLQLDLAGLHYQGVTLDQWKNLLKASEKLDEKYNKWIAVAQKGAIMDTGEDCEWKKTDGVRHDANDLAKFMCMLYDITFQNPTKMFLVFKFLQELFPDDPTIAVWVINKFNSQYFYNNDTETGETVSHE